ncbi:restriction endonuclease subunit S [Rhodococcus ruber]|uniref:restriction endonuclease subunit S n=1 Tax=Rhodococcus ruber TaxID=1830 RepID=UPI0011AB8050|nr:restriction endonuclease subunit S [Rhodococcus ruber]MBD8057273.1 restriction endonuclease subunit S [Rhodococcus ruber]
MLAGIKDGTHGTFARVADGVPLLSAKNVHDYGLQIGAEESLISREDYLEITRVGYPKRGDVLLTIVGTIGRTCVFDSDTPLAFQRSVCFLRPNRHCNPAFLSYVVRSSPFQNQLNLAAKTAAQSGVYMGDVAACLLALPSRDEQGVICSFLDRETAKIDALIGKQQQLIATLREDRTATITDAVTKGLNPHADRKDSRIESLGMVPQHWTVTPLKHVLRKEPGAIKAGPFGSDLTASEMAGDFAKVYNQRAVLDEDPLAGPEWVTEFKYQELGAFRVSPGDVLVTTRGSIGRAFEVPSDAPKGVLHPCVIRVRADQARLSNEFFLILLNETPTLRAQFSLLSNATTIDVIYSGTLASCIVPVPPKSEQQQIVAYVREQRSKIDSLISKATEMVRTLQEFRSALITDAVTGKIDVREVN